MLTTKRIKSDLLECLLDSGLSEKEAKYLLPMAYHCYMSTGCHETDVDDAVCTVQECYDGDYRGKLDILHWLNR